MKYSAIALIGLMTALTPVSGLPVADKLQTDDLEKRQGIIETIIISAIIGAGKGALGAVLGPDKPACTWKSTHDDQNWWARATRQVDGKEVTFAEFCWTEGGYKFNDNDANAAICLNNLHTQQKSTCIDLEGSSCNFPNSAVGNTRTYYDFSGKSDQQLSADSAERANAAISKLPEAMADKGWDISTNVVIQPMNDDGTYTSWTVQLRGTGDEDC
ncbi:hypothetical protein AK830_g7293 [Neonectria ditissima]|uniref:Ecp2 effector protein domain-containing protein n=1 Tax=Neonectria ditissima TaxID=78410 RepID=A0A0P7BFZ0_9HYPO|nr:hypothetical protein AK830_g7293 [Neonectria ditissima]